MGQKVIAGLPDIQKQWKVLVAFGVWVSSVAGSFILPMPAWSTHDVFENQYGQFNKLLTIVSAIVAGFALYYVVRYSAKAHIKKWLYGSVISCALFFTAFCTYSYYHLTYTLPYMNRSMVIGTDYQPGAIENLADLEKEGGFRIPENDILYQVSGEASLIWKEDGIKRNTVIMKILIVIAYSLFSLFVVCFTNLLFINKKTAPRAKSK